MISDETDSTNSIQQDQYVLLSPKISLFRTDHPPRRVTLPLKHSVKRDYAALTGLGMVFIGFVFASALPSLLSNGPTISAGYAFRLVIGSLMLLMAPLALLQAVQHLMDAAKNGPVLVIGPTRLLDQRSGIDLAWSEMSSGKVEISRTYVSVLITAPNARQSRTLLQKLRDGRAFWNPSVYRCETSLLDGSSGDIATTILVLIRHHGGDVENVSAPLHQPGLLSG